MTENMCFESILYMHIIAGSVVLGEWSEVCAYKNYELVPFLMNQ